MKITTNAPRKGQDLNLFPLVYSMLAEGWEDGSAVTLANDLDGLASVGYDKKAIEAACKEIEKHHRSDEIKGLRLPDGSRIPSISFDAASRVVESEMLKYEGQALLSGNRRFLAYCIAKAANPELKAKYVKLGDKSPSTVVEFQRLEFEYNEATGAMAPSDESYLYLFLNEAERQGTAVVYLSVAKKVWTFDFQSKSTLRGKFTAIHRLYKLSQTRYDWEQLKKMKGGEIEDVVSGKLINGKRDAATAAKTAEQADEMIAAILGKEAPKYMTKDGTSGLLSALITCGLKIEQNKLETLLQEYGDTVKI